MKRQRRPVWILTPDATFDPAARVARRWSSLAKLIVHCVLLTAAAIPAAAEQVSRPDKPTLRAASKQIRDGLNQFKAGNLDEAEAAFDEANEALPDHPRVAYNLACVAAARGEAERAIELFNKATSSQNSAVVANSHYNLGCVLAGQAKSLFGTAAEDADGGKRDEGLRLLTRAIGHYRQAIRTDSKHTAARKNLELLRLWMKHMQQIWREKDQQAERDGMSLLQFLEHLHEQQHVLRQESRSTATRQASPHRRHQTRLLRKRQGALIDELPHLLAKIQQALAGQQQPATSGTTPAPAQPNAQMVEAMQTLRQAIERIQKQMSSAEQTMAAGQLNSALVPQRRALDELDRVYLAIAPFQELLGRSIKLQENLVQQSATASTAAKPKKAATPPADTGPRTASADPVHLGARANRRATLPNPVEIDHDDLAWQQQLISRWSQGLRFKADMEKQQLPATAPQEATTPENPDADPCNDGQNSSSSGQNQSTPPSAAAGKQAARNLGATGSRDEQAARNLGATDGQDEQSAPDGRDEQADQRIQALARMYDKAIELTPQIEKLSAQASSKLQGEDVAGALPDQREVLRLLKEIAKTQPPDQQQQNKQQQKQNQQQDKQQQKQDQQDSSDQQDDQKKDSRDQQDKQNSKKKQDENQNRTGKKNNNEKKKDDDKKKSGDDKKKDDKKKSEDKTRGDKRKKDDKSKSDKARQSDKKQQSAPPDQKDAAKRPDEQSRSREEIDPRQLLSRRQAESILQRVREREREHRERLRKLRRMSLERIKIDKDW